LDPKITFLKLQIPTRLRVLFSPLIHSGSAATELLFVSQRDFVVKRLLLFSTLLFFVLLAAEAEDIGQLHIFFDIFLSSLSQVLSNLSEAGPS